MADKRTTKKRPAKTVSKKQVVTPKEQPRNGFRSFAEFFRFGESYTSLVLGIVVVIAVAWLLVSFARTNPHAPEVSRQDISSTNTQSTTDQQTTVRAGSTYTVQPGDDLWNIALKAYNDGYQWTRIAEANSITDPDMLVSGTELKLPEKEAIAQTTVTPAPQVSVSPTVVARDGTSPTPTVIETQSSAGPPAERITGSTYTVQRGDSLWMIAVKAYGDGYRWVDIAKANNLHNPGTIHAGNVFQIPQKG